MPSDNRRSIVNPFDVSEQSRHALRWAAALAASDYSLLDESTGFTPKPNYWGALLWRRLMGERFSNLAYPFKPVYMSTRTAFDTRLEAWRCSRSIQTELPGER